MFRRKFRKLYAILFLALFVVLLNGAKRVLSIKSEHGIRQARDLYVQPKNTIDVVFLGSSHIHCDINTALLWQDYGIAAYDYSAAEQPLWLTYYYLKEFCKTQKPKAIVLDLYSPAAFYGDYQYTWLKDNLNGVRFSLNKLMMLGVACEPADYADYFPSISTYHSRYKELTAEDWDYLTTSDKERASFKGYTPYFSTAPHETPILQESYNELRITDKSVKYLKEIIHYAGVHGIPLYVIVCPYNVPEEHEYVYWNIKEICEDSNVYYRDFNYEYEEMGLDFKTDLNDDSHLNYLGSAKFTDYLARILKESQELPDHRGDPDWESWDRHVLEINSLISQHS